MSENFGEGKMPAITIPFAGLMEKDLVLTTDFFEHPKIKKLKQFGGQFALISFIILWHWAANHLHRQGYNFGNISVEGISKAANWLDNPYTFVRILIDAELLSVDDDYFPYLETEDVPVRVIDTQKNK